MRDNQSKRLIMRSTLRIMVLMLIAGGCARAADACSCMSSGPPCQNFFQSEAVFVGTVTAIATAETTGDRVAPPVYTPRRVVAFMVEKGVRGIQSATVDVRTGS